MAIIKGEPTSAVALASATSASGTARNGAAVFTNQIMKGTLTVRCDVTIVTGSVVATITWEVSHDNGTTWTVMRDYANTAPTTITATATRVLSAPRGVHAYNQVRAVATLSGAATAAGDLTALTYYWRPYTRSQ